ncbi:hypothetical protein [Muricoccus radiodurans]|uniref:hypothetical protein n=1 Tax=Muricoccus radiodurans TaxID=2231721 RepID=UPI003CF3ACCF
MIVWRGWGILTVVIGPAVCVLVASLLSEWFGGVPGFAGWPAVLGLLAAAAANWSAGRWFNGRPGRELVDARTGQRVVLRQVNDLFWIPMQWWSVPIVLLAIAVAFQVLTGTWNPPR